jgi:DNA-binding transcriptional ArsR family regulator
MSLETLRHRARLLSCQSRLNVWLCVGDTGMYAGDIARTRELAASTTSYHLRVLERAGLVRHTRQGRFRLYECTGTRWGVVSEDEVDAFAS